ncbi:MAG: hypothetical protein L3J23_09960 [Flavobacteriaceae bacterium]|nr:hypothetical protein [Flavobacteriaceae bacterium]
MALVFVLSSFSIDSFVNVSEVKPLSEPIDMMMILDGIGLLSSCTDQADDFCGSQNYECWFGYMSKCDQR